MNLMNAVSGKKCGQSSRLPARFPDVVLEHKDYHIPMPHSFGNVRQLIWVQSSLRKYPPGEKWVNYPRLKLGACPWRYGGLLPYPRRLAY
jgi:hypothetical protein